MSATSKKRITRIVLIVGVLAGSLALCSPSSEAGPFRRGWNRGYGWGGVNYGPRWGYRPAYRPFGPGMPGFGMRYPGFGRGYPGYGLGMYGGNPGYGMGYPGVYGTSMSFGNPMGGFFMGSYPY